MEYLEGRDRSYPGLLQAYRKKEENSAVCMTDSMDYAQIFWGEKNSFSEERAENYRLEAAPNSEIRMEIVPDAFPDTDCVRIDPANWPVLIEVIAFEVETEDSVRKLSADDFITNAMDAKRKRWVFLSGDPQILIPIRAVQGWKKITFVYRVIMEHLEKIDVCLKEVVSAERNEQQKWKKKVQEKQDMIDGQSRLLNQCARELTEAEHKIQLLKDKLAYIESTKAYQTLLKKKVESIHLWDEIN